MRTSTSEKLDEFSKAFPKAQALIQPALKKSTAGSGNYKYNYAELSDVWCACQDALNSNGFSILQYGVPSDKQGYIAMATRLLHESGQWLEGVMESPLIKADPQGVGSVTTYLRRYSLAAMVGVPMVDDDGKEGSIPPNKTQKNKTNHQQAQDKDKLIREVQALMEQRGLNKDHVEYFFAIKLESTKNTIQELNSVKTSLIDLYERVDRNDLSSKENEIFYPSGRGL